MKKFNPQPDITADEIALTLKYANMELDDGYVLPPELHRHFIKVESPNTVYVGEQSRLGIKWHYRI